MPISRAVGTRASNPPELTARRRNRNSSAQLRSRRDTRPYLLKTFVVVLALVLSTFAHATELDIPIFSGGYGTAFYEETARLFEAERPGVTVKLYGDPRISDKIRVRMIDGNPPDVSLPRDLLIPTLARAGKLRDLTPYLDGLNWEGDARWRDTFLPGALDSWVVDGRTYGLPLSYACWTIFYNRAVFREHGWTEPQTWEEFFALCEKIKATGLAPVSTTGIYPNYPDAFLRAAFYNLAGADGWRALNDLAPGSRADPRYVRAADVLQRITQNYTLRGWEGATHTAAQLAFIQGRAAMTVSGSWMLYEMGDKIPSDFELGVMNFPRFADGVADPTTIQAGADSFFLFATGDPVREQLSVDFLRFLTSRTRAEAFVRRTDSPVAVRGVPVEAFTPRMRETAAMISDAREAFNMPQVMQQSPAIRQALIDARSQLMIGKITPQQFATRIEEAAANDRVRALTPNAVEYRHPVAGTLLILGLSGTALWLGTARWRARRVNSIKVGAAVPRRPEFAPPNLIGPKVERDVPIALETLRSQASPTRTSGSTSTELKQSEARADTRLVPGRDSYFGRLRAPVAAGFVGPSLFIYLLLAIGPALTAFTWAFTKWDGLSERTWNGLFNFKWLLFESDLVWAALANNLFLMVVPAVVVLPLALLFAYLLHRGIWGAKVFRAVFLFPNLLGGIAATLLWLGAYEPHGGLINAGLVALGNLTNSDWLRDFQGYPWLAQSNLYVALVPIYIWMACGFNLVLFLAAMEGVDEQLYEAAELDGAPAWRQFFFITLPLIWEVVVIAGVFIVISGLNAFEMIWLLTSQDPDSSTHTLGTLMVTSMFKEFEVGRATAIAVLLFVLVLAGSAALMRGLKREGVEQ